MENEHIKKIFLDIAVAAISCDGDIDEREITKLKEIEKNSPYFSEFDLAEPLNESLENSMKDLKTFQNQLFFSIRSADLNIVHQLSAIDISLEIISADNKIEQSEIEFIKLLRENLIVSDELVLERFGDIDYLFSKNESEFNQKPGNNFGEAQTDQTNKK
jgi:uncharacterized tellurite resistance protein B-like protein